jgi:hypothetical protein
VAQGPQGSAGVTSAWAGGLHPQPLKDSVSGRWLRITAQRAREAAAMWEAENYAWEGSGIERIQSNLGGIQLRSGTRVVYESGRGYMTWIPEARL